MYIRKIWIRFVESAQLKQLKTSLQLRNPKSSIPAL